MFITHNWLITRINSQVLSVINVNLLHVDINCGRKYLAEVPLRAVPQQDILSVASAENTYIFVYKTHILCEITKTDLH